MTPVAVDTAIALIRRHAPAPRPTRVALTQAMGRILLADVSATRDQPPFDASAMDGYALARPLEPGQDLTVIGESQAGKAFAGPLRDGQTVRVFTGAPLPAGTTRVLMQEDVVRDGKVIRLREDAQPGAKPHIRLRGSDFRAGDRVLQPGDRLTGWRLALAASTGQAKVTVSRRPRVAVIGTGDELVLPGAVARDDQIFESNTIALAALARTWGANVTRAASHRDDRDDLARAIIDAPADILVTIGGASVGDYDLIRPTLDALGVKWLFEKVDIKPGKPTAFGILGDGRRVLCLPGNPGSALICAQLFLKPLIETTLGAQATPMPSALPCATGLPANGGRETFLRAVVLNGADRTPVLLPLSAQDCSQCQPFAVTTALIRRRAHAPAVAPGEVCECLWLDT